MSLMRPYINKILTQYLDNKVLEEFLIHTLVGLLLVDDLVFSFLVDLLNELVDSFHLLDSSIVLNSGLLNSKFNLILLELCLVILHNLFLFFLNIV